MNGDQWTFLVVRGRDGPVRQYSVSMRLARAVAGFGILAVGVASFVIVTFGIDGAATLRASKLAAQNQILRGELAEFQHRLGQLEESFGQLSERDAWYRTVAGLESIDPEIMEVGVGGPGLGTPESHALWPIDSAATKAVFAASYDLNALERRARLLAESLAEAGDSVLSHQEQMRATPSILPTDGYFSSSFSASRMHPIHNRPLPHPGVDIAAPAGTPIYAAARGRVIRSQQVPGYGLTVEIDHGFGYTTLYGHASRLLVTRGQEVERGDVIAQVGATGIATASHVHYEVRLNGIPQNPRRFILPGVIP